MVKRFFIQLIFIISTGLYAGGLFAHAPSEFKGHSYEVHSVSFSKNGKLMASGSGDRTAIVWNIETKEPVFTINSHNRTIYSVAFSKIKNNLLATSSSDGHLILWDVDTKSIMATLVKGDTTSNGILDMEFSPTKNILAVSYMNGELVLWDADTFETIDRVFAHPYGFAMSVTFSPNGERLVTTGGVDNSVVLFETKGLKERARFGNNFLQNKDVHDYQNGEYVGTIWDAAFAPDGYTIVTVNSAGKLSLWKEGSVSPRAELIVNDYLAQSVVVTKDGKKAIVGVDGYNSEEGNFIKVIDLGTMQIEAEVSAHKNRIRGIDLSPDGRFIATASWDETVKIWDVSKLKE